ncbi:hypothetical protein ABZ092_28965 [Streptomyces bobili]|uniref:hypothetical protein n=1 Tax=Streptomyces bobili TaxID=67280 RepID=UPI0033A6BC32
MAVLLLGIVSTHGLSAESPEGHLVTSAARPVAMVHEGILGAQGEQTGPRLLAIAEPGGGHGSSHTSEHCVSGQPQQGPVLTPPCFAVSASESTKAGCVSGRRIPSKPALAAVSSTAQRMCVVQQV